MTAGQIFLKELVSCEIADSCYQFIGRSIVDNASILQIGTAVRNRLHDAFGFSHHQLSVIVSPDRQCHTELNIVPGNLYTYLVMEGIRPPELPPGVNQYTNDDGTYCYRSNGGWFVPAT